MYQKTYIDQKDGLSAKEYDKAMQKYETDAFKRGIMNFDDYNYNQFNNYILHDDQNKGEEDDNEYRNMMFEENNSASIKNIKQIDL